MKKSILVLGSFDNNNAESAAELWAVLQKLSMYSLDLHFIIPSLNPQFISTYFLDFDCEAPQVYINPRRGHMYFFGPATLSVLDRTAVVLTVGDFISMDRAVDRETIFSLGLILLLRAAAWKHIPVFGYGLRITLPTHWLEKRVIRHILACHSMVFAGWHDIIPALKEWALPCQINPGVNAAIDLSLLPISDIEDLLTMHMVDVTRPFVALIVTPSDKNEAYLLDILMYLSQCLSVNPVLICTSVEAKQVALHLTERLNHWIPMIYYPLLSHREITGILSKADLIITTNLQSCMLAASSGTPMLSLSEHPSATATMQALGLEKYALKLTDISPAVMLSCIGEAWELRAQLKGILHEHIRQLLALAEIQNNAFFTLLEKQR
ncbi:MAG TPA: hypothetical protein ENN32_05280 [Chloroflexi bacterium]|nr:hypothetical protein [Chloroflexota bacterium]